MVPVLTLVAANFHVTQYDKGPILRPDERRYFNEGKAAYYHHVLALFEEAKATTFVVDFAELALASLHEESNKVSSIISPIDMPHLTGGRTWINGDIFCQDFQAPASALRSSSELSIALRNYLTMHCKLHTNFHSSHC